MKMPSPWLGELMGGLLLPKNDIDHWSFLCFPSYSIPDITIAPCHVPPTLWHFCQPRIVTVVSKWLIVRLRWIKKSLVSKFYIWFTSSIIRLVEHRGGEWLIKAGGEQALLSSIKGEKLHWKPPKVSALCLGCEIKQNIKVLMLFSNVGDRK